MRAPRHSARPTRRSGLLRAAQSFGNLFGQRGRVATAELCTLDGTPQAPKPMRIARRIVLSFGAAIGIVVVGGLAFGFAMSDATKYCPWSHHVSDLSSCEVLDEANGRVLVQHADLDSNVYYLELIESNGQSSCFELPEGIGQLAPQGYTARLVSNSPDHIILNSKNVRLTALP